MPLEPETLQYLFKKSIFLRGAHHHWKNLLRHAGELQYNLYNPNPANPKFRIIRTHIL